MARPREGAPQEGDRRGREGDRRRGARREGDPAPGKGRGEDPALDTGRAGDPPPGKGREPRRRDGPGGGPLRQEAPRPGRTVERTRCRIDAFFGARVIDPDGERVAIRFSELQPELAMPTNGTLELVIGVTAVADTPGTLTVEVTREAPGLANPPRRQMDANSVADIKAWTDAQPAIGLPPPPGVSKDNPEVVELLTAVVTWDPADADPCEIRERLRIRWLYAAPGSDFKFAVSRKKLTETTVRIGRSLAPEPFGGRNQRTVPVQTYWVVKDPKRCCDAAGEHTVIQFVRHTWHLKETPKEKRGGDSWSLDVLSSEVDRAKATPPQPYDPTYTHNPRGTAPNAEPIVYPGAGPGGAINVIQIDRPGFDDRLYDRLKAAGGKLRFEFRAFLVCRRAAGDAADYLASGSVAQRISYVIEFVVDPAGSEPRVSGAIDERKELSPCRSLKDVLADLDKSAKPPAGKMLDGYNKPRGHTIAIPK